MRKNLVKLLRENLVKFLRENLVKFLRKNLVKLLRKNLVKLLRENLVKDWGRSQFTFTPFCRFLTTHLPLVYNHLHSNDHLPICKRLHMRLDHPLTICT